jgi:iron complex outermembrane receptor protein
MIRVPAARTDNSIRYPFDSTGRTKKIYAGLTNLAMAKQSSVPPTSDYVPAPAGYDLWGAELGCSVPFLKKQIDLSITVSNLTSLSYRDYLDRFQYFINEPGRNVILEAVGSILAIPL